MGHWNWILGQESARNEARNKVVSAGFRNGAWRVPRPLAMGWSGSHRSSEPELSLGMEVTAQLVHSLSPLSLKLKVMLYLASRWKFFTLRTIQGQEKVSTASNEFIPELMQARCAQESRTSAVSALGLGLGVLRQAATQHRAYRVGWGSHRAGTAQVIKLGLVHSFHMPLLTIPPSNSWSKEVSKI